MVYSIKCEDLIAWVKNIAKPGDLAYWYNHDTERIYTYLCKGFDDNPFWTMWYDYDTLQKYLDTLKEEPKMEKRCDNCKYFGSYKYKNGIGVSWCDHKEHKGMLVSNFTSCPEHKFKEKKSTPFDGIKFYLKDQDTGELSLGYICEDCGKEMDGAPDHWWLVLPVGKGESKRRSGYHFRCGDCEQKAGGKR
jgi:hypothetical protein